MSEQVIDLDEFLERVQEDKELLLELLDIFQDDFATKRKMLGEAVESNDLEQIKNISHSLKGASGNISAKPLREVFVKFEDMGRIGDLKEAGDVLAVLDKESEALFNHMDELREKFKA